MAEASQIAWQWSRAGRPDVKWRSALIDDEQLKSVYSQVKEKVSRVAATLSIPVTGSGSLTRDQFSKDLEKITIRLGSKIRDASLINVVNSEENHSTIANSPRSLLLKIAQELQLIFSISDVALLLPDTENGNFLTLYELNHIQPVSKFSIDNSDSKVIRSYLDKVNFWIEPEKKDAAITPISDRQIIRRLNHDIALSLPLGYGGHVFGAVVIGSSKVQKKYLTNQTNFISSYLENISNSWLKNSRHDPVDPGRWSLCRTACPVNVTQVTVQERRNRHHLLRIPARMPRASHATGGNDRETEHSHENQKRDDTFCIGVTLQRLRRLGQWLRHRHAEPRTDGLAG